jgi:triacylglycerol lipase
MLARLQKFTTLGLLALAGLWALLAWRSGHPAWAVGGAALITFSYALVLALEFLLLRAVHGDDPTPRATPAQLLRAWCGEAGSAPLVFCWRQPFRSRRWPDHIPSDATGRRGIVLVHGFICNRGIWNPWMKRLLARNVPYVAVNLEPVFGSIDQYFGVIDSAVARLEYATGLPPVIVAHSMGGLAVRRWWAAPENHDRVHHAITIASPHTGTWLARFAMTPNGLQMRRHSTWLQALAAHEPAHHAARSTCFYGHCDNIVFPPATAALQGADNRHLSGVAHVHMVTRPEPWEEAWRWLS